MIHKCEQCYRLYTISLSVAEEKERFCSPDCEEESWREAAQEE